jgi:hypothetical protein
MSLSIDTSIEIARSILNDTDSTSYRYTTSDLLQFGNDALDQMVTLIPSLFYTQGEVECVEGALQSINFDEARALVDVIGVKDGSAVIPCDKKALDTFSPSWINSATGAAKNWMAAPNDPIRFYVYPPSPDAQVLDVIYVRTPEEYEADDPTGVPETYADAVADYIVYRAESRDDEHVISQRVQAYYQSFLTKCQGG